MPAPDTYAESYIDSTVTKPGAAAHKTAQNKIDQWRISGVGRVGKFLGAPESPEFQTFL